MNPTRKSLDAIAKGGGNFTEVKGSLLLLFDQGGRSRRWREIFGLERSRPARNGGVSFTGREER